MWPPIGCVLGMNAFLGQRLCALVAVGLGPNAVQLVGLYRHCYEMGDIEERWINGEDEDIGSVVSRVNA